MTHIVSEWSFLIAGIYGLLVITPLYWRETQIAQGRPAPADGYRPRGLSAAHGDRSATLRQPRT
jgi:hypothetical protein